MKRWKNNELRAKKRILIRTAAKNKGDNNNHVRFDSYTFSSLFLSVFLSACIPPLLLLLFRLFCLKLCRICGVAFSLYSCALCCVCIVQALFRSLVIYSHSRRLPSLLHACIHVVYLSVSVCLLYAARQ